MKPRLANILIQAMTLAVLCLPALRAAAQQDVPPSVEADPKKAKLAEDAVKKRAAANAERAKETAALLKTLAAKPTPKTADGHTDLSGFWVPPNEGPANVVVEGNRHDLVFGDYGVEGIIPGAQNDPNAVELTIKKSREEQIQQRLAARRPEYKPEFQEKVKAMVLDPQHSDPTTYRCMQPGVPRIGAPTYILQTPTQVFLLYSQRSTTRPSSTFRVVPIDGLPHPKSLDPSPNGDSVGHWEGDTLVVDVTNLDDSTWISGDGTFHSLAMHVTERFTRTGDTLQYSAKVEDPKVLVKSFDVTPKPTMLKIGGPDDTPEPDYPCQQSDIDHFVTDPNQ